MRDQGAAAAAAVQGLVTSLSSLHSLSIRDGALWISHAAFSSLAGLSRLSRLDLVLQDVGQACMARIAALTTLKVRVLARGWWCASFS